MKVTAGIGWGKFAGENSFDNPLSFIIKKLNVRPVIQELEKEELLLMINGSEVMQLVWRFRIFSS